LYNTPIIPSLLITSPSKHEFPVSIGIGVGFWYRNRQHLPLLPFSAHHITNISIVSIVSGRINNISTGQAIFQTLCPRSLLKKWEVIYGKKFLTGETSLPSCGKLYVSQKSWWLAFNN